MQSLKEILHVPGVSLNRIMTASHLVKTCKCSAVSESTNNQKRFEPTKASMRTFQTLSLKHNNSQLKKNIDSRYNCIHSSTTVLQTKNISPTELSELVYETIAEETLESLSEFFDELQEIAPCSEDYDAGLGNGVLTVHFSGSDGTYVINKQTPNKQIWLSSPLTGPKRYDYCDGKWIYIRDGIGIHTLLEEEISEILGVKVSMKKCKYFS